MCVWCHCNSVYSSAVRKIDGHRRRGRARETAVAAAATASRSYQMHPLIRWKPPVSSSDPVVYTLAPPGVPPTASLSSRVPLCQATHGLPSFNTRPLVFLPFHAAARRPTRLTLRCWLDDMCVCTCGARFVCAFQGELQLPHAHRSGRPVGQAGRRGRRRELRPAPGGSDLRRLGLRHQVRIWHAIPPPPPEKG